MVIFFGLLSWSKAQYPLANVYYICKHALEKSNSSSQGLIRDQRHVETGDLRAGIAINFKILFMALGKYSALLGFSA